MPKAEKLPEVEEWERDVRAPTPGSEGKDRMPFWKPPEGKFTITITEPIKIVNSPQFGPGPAIPTNKGLFSTKSRAILNPIKEFKHGKGRGTYLEHSFTFEASGAGRDRRYKFISAK